MYEAPDLTQQQLAAALVVTKGNVSQILKIMERDGLIVRERGVGGSNHIILTAAAQAIFMQLDADHRAFTHTFFANFSKAEADQFAALLHKLMDEFTNDPTDNTVCEEPDADSIVTSD